MVETRARTLADCAFRQVVDSDASGQEGLSVCGLLSDISGVRTHPALTVPVTACEACCRSHLPSKADLNSVVASLLVGLAEQISAEGGVPGCTYEQAKQLAAWAEKCLPAVSFDEDDTTDVAAHSYGHLSEISADEIERLLPVPEESKCFSDNAVRTWAVGVTTSPRRLATVEPCVESVIRAGWDEPVLFVDGEVELSQQLVSLESCRRQPALGAFPNFALSLSELYMRDPHADAYLMIQDDAIFLPSLATREYLERVLWPDAGAYMASLYCSKKYNQVNAGWHLFPENWVWGAVAFVFSNSAVHEILTSATLLHHRALPGRDGLSKIDVVLGRIAREKEIPLIFPSPSLVQHIGTVSTIWDHARAVNARYADQFIGDLLTEKLN